MISIKPFPYKPGEHEAEKASNSYLMSVIALIAGVPLPIVNLIATLIFFLGNRKGTYFVRWHCTQALLSQLSLLMINSVGFWWTISVVFGTGVADTPYFAYIITVLLFNLAEFVATVYTSIQTRKGVHVTWWFYGGLTDLLVSETAPGVRKTMLQLVFLVFCFAGLLYGLGKVNWPEVFKVQQTKRTMEEKLGDILWKTFRQSGDEVNDTKVTAPVDSLLTRLCRENHIDRSSIKLHIVRQDEVNAFALPDQHLVVFTGLIEACENEAELCGVLGHELAHIAHRHVMKKLVREVGLSVLMSATTGNGGGDAAKSALKVLSSSAYDRELEREADIASVDYMVQAGIDPEPFSRFMYRLGEKQEGMPGQLFWISSHPASEERAVQIAAYAAHKQLTPRSVLSRAEWEALKAHLKNK